MSRLSVSRSIKVTEEMKQRAEQAAKNGYKSEAEYMREMWLAGESTVGALDPRVGGNAVDGTTKIDSAEVAARALDDGTLLKALPTSEGDKQALDEAIRPIMQEFETVLVERIVELRDDDQSAVTDDGRGNYYLKG